MREAERKILDDLITYQFPKEKLKKHIKDVRTPKDTYYLYLQHPKKAEGYKEGWENCCDYILQIIKGLEKEEN